jgi:hypothetical protein
MFHGSSLLTRYLPVQDHAGNCKTEMSFRGRDTSACYEKAKTKAARFQREKIMQSKCFRICRRINSEMCLNVAMAPQTL